MYPLGKSTDPTPPPPDPTQNIKPATGTGESILLHNMMSTFNFRGGFMLHRPTPTIIHPPASPMASAAASSSDPPQVQFPFFRIRTNHIIPNNNIVNNGVNGVVLPSSSTSITSSNSDNNDEQVILELIAKDTPVLLDRLNPANINELVPKLKAFRLEGNKQRVPCFVNIVFERAIDPSCPSNNNYVTIATLLSSLCKSYPNPEEMSKKLAKQIRKSYNKEILQTKHWEGIQSQSVRRRASALIGFIRELYKGQLFDAKLTAKCLNFALYSTGIVLNDGILESICLLLADIGKQLEQELQYADPPWKGKLLTKLEQLSEGANGMMMSGEVRSTVVELIKLWKRDWKPVILNMPFHSLSYSGALTNNLSREEGVGGDNPTERELPLPLAPSPPVYMPPHKRASVQHDNQPNINFKAPEKVFAVSAFIRQNRENEAPNPHDSNLANLLTALPGEDKGSITIFVGGIFESVLERPSTAPSYARMLQNICYNSIKSEATFKLLVQKIVQRFRTEFNLTAGEKQAIKGMENELANNTGINGPDLQRHQEKIEGRKSLQRKKALTLVGFVCELYKANILTAKFMVSRIDRFMNEEVDQENFESVCLLLTEVGEGLDRELKILDGWRDKAEWRDSENGKLDAQKFMPKPKWMGSILQKLESGLKNPTISAELRAEISKLLRMRQNGWKLEGQGEAKQANVNVPNVPTSSTTPSNGTTGTVTPSPQNLSPPKKKKKKKKEALEAAADDIQTSCSISNKMSNLTLSTPRHAAPPPIPVGNSTTLSSSLSSLPGSSNGTSGKTINPSSASGLFTCEEVLEAEMKSAALALQGPGVTVEQKLELLKFIRECSQTMESLISLRKAVGPEVVTK